MTDENLFYMVMEADGDELTPFDPNMSDDTGNVPTTPAPPDQSSPQGADNGSGDDLPPPLNEDSDFQFSDEPDGGANANDNGNQPNDDNTDDKNSEKLSEKANNILNQRLYQKMINLNSDTEEIINNLQTITPLLPYEIVKLNDEPLNNLKTALAKGQNYVISQFVDAQYGENLLFYQKLDALYTLLKNSINENLKKIKK